MLSLVITKIYILIGFVVAALATALLLLQVQYDPQFRSAFLLMEGYTFPRLFCYESRNPHTIFFHFHISSFSTVSSASYCSASPLLLLPLLFLRMSSTLALILLSSHPMQIRSKSSICKLNFQLSLPIALAL